MIRRYNSNTTVPLTHMHRLPFLQNLVFYSNICSWGGSHDLLSPQCVHGSMHMCASRRNWVLASEKCWTYVIDIGLRVIWKIYKRLTTRARLCISQARLHKGHAWLHTQGACNTTTIIRMSLANITGRILFTKEKNDSRDDIRSIKTYNMKL